MRAHNPVSGLNVLATYVQRELADAIKQVGRDERVAGRHQKLDRNRCRAARR